MSNLRSRQPGKTFLTTIAALALLAALSTLGARAVAAEAALVEVEIPAGPLDRSLLAISSAFNVDILAPDELIADRRAVALSGALSAAEALDRVLQGSGLEARPAEDGAYLVAENGEETEEEPIQMAPLTVEGEAQSARFWLSDLPEVYEGGQVGSGGRVGLLGNQDVFDTPFSVTSYTSELIENQQARTVADVIRNDASAHLLGPGQGIREEIGIRGFSLGNNLSDGNLYDGLPGLHFQYGSSTVQTLERVEVFKGPNALLNGISSRVGGAVNLVPKRPTDTALTRLTADYDYQSRLGAHADLSRRFGAEKQFGTRLNAIYRNGEGAIEENKEKSGEAALALEYRGDRLKLETILHYSDRELRGGDQYFSLSRDATAVPSAPDLENARQQPWEKTNIKSAHGLLRAEYAFGRDWAVHAAYGTLTAEEYRLLTFGDNLNARGDFNPQFRLQRYKQNTYAWNTGVKGKFETGEVMHQVSIETMQTKYGQRLPKNWPSSILNSSNLYDPVFVARPVFNDSPGGWVKRREFLDSSIAIADTLGFLDERVLLTAGIRRQSIDVKNFNFNTGAVRSRYDKSAITPAFGLLVKPWDFMSLYGNYIEALERGPTAPTGTVNEGEVFPPSVTDQIEFGVKFDLDGLGLTAGLFQIERPSGITNATTNRFSLNGQQRNRGLELNAFGEVRPNLRLLGGITYLDSKMTRTQGGRFDGNDAVGVPELTAVLNLEYDTAAFPGLTLTARAEHVSSRFVRADNSLKIPSYELYGIGARYQRTLGDKAFTLRLNIDNLLGKDYWNTATGFDNTLYLGAPRRINLSFSVAF